MSLLQLNPTVPLDTPQGKADAHFLIDYSEQHALLFVVFLRETGECWTLDSRQVRLERNVTMGVRVGPGDLPAGGREQGGSRDSGRRTDTATGPGLPPGH
jgi:hypothetical protein